MYFSYGWPKTLALLDDESEVLVDLQADRHDERIIVLTTTTIQVWSAGKVSAKVLAKVQLSTFVLMHALILTIDYGIHVGCCPYVVFATATCEAGRDQTGRGVVGTAWVQQAVLGAGEAWPASRSRKHLSDFA
eukprot:5050409-Pyramimonas_sp.AAC.3